MKKTRMKFVQRFHWPFVYYVLIIFSWWVGVWHECSKTCGHAVKLRAVLCTQIVVDNIKVIDDEKCSGKKPVASAVCKQPLCWLVHPWFNVSTLRSHAMKTLCYFCEEHICFRLKDRATQYK